MDEFKFVLRLFLMACLLVAGTQVKVDHMTVEAHLKQWLVSEPVAQFVNQAAQGGAKLLRESYFKIRNEFDKKNSQNSHTHQQHSSHGEKKETGEAGGWGASPVRYNDQITSENLTD